LGGRAKTICMTTQPVGLWGESRRQRLSSSATFSLSKPNRKGAPYNQSVAPSVKHNGAIRDRPATESRTKQHGVPPFDPRGDRS
jgi:hypothetical protein